MRVSCWRKIIKTILPLSETDKAYIAAYIDGEGCITISRSGKNYRLYLDVASTNRNVLEWLQQTTGLGQIHKGKQNSPKHKIHYRWTLWAKQAKQLLENIYPYMIVKKDRAILGIDFMNKMRYNVGIKGLTLEEINYKISTYEQFKLLNKRGI